MNRRNWQFGQRSNQSTINPVKLTAEDIKQKIEKDREDREYQINKSYIDKLLQMKKDLYRNSTTNTSVIINPSDETRYRELFKSGPFDGFKLEFRMVESERDADRYYMTLSLK